MENCTDGHIFKRRAPLGFIHLHNHTDYSLLDSIVSIPGYIGKAQKCVMQSLAITDHGNMFGAISFYEACRSSGINPIIGTEFNIAADDGYERRNKDSHHLVLLAMDDADYHNLMKLNSIAYTEGFHEEPRIDKKTLDSFVPLYADPETSTIATQYPVARIGNCGLVRMDLLGLKTLMIIDHTVRPSVSSSQVSISPK